MKKISTLEKILVASAYLSTASALIVPQVYLSNGNLNEAEISLVAGLVLTYAFGIAATNMYVKRL